MSNAPTANRGFLGWVERTGNALPDPVFLFFYLIIAVVIMSVIATVVGVSETLSPQILSGMPESQKARFGMIHEWCWIL